MVCGQSGRSPVKIAIFIEEPSSQKPIQIFVRKILGKKIGTVIRVKKRGDLLNKEKIEAYIENDILLEHNDILKFVVCVDSECTPEKEMAKITRRIETSLKSKVIQPLHYIIVTHAFEGWLLSDPISIKEYLGPRAKVTIPASASKVCKPKALMQDIFRKADRDYHYTIENARIADLSDPKRMVKKSTSFKKFYEIIKDP